MKKGKVMKINNNAYTTFGRGTGFQPHPPTPPPKNPTQLNFEKIFYKSISLCNFACFELSFKASESLKLLIFRCELLHFSQNFLIFLIYFASKNLFMPSSPLMGKNYAMVLILYKYIDVES